MVDRVHGVLLLKNSVGINWVYQKGEGWAETAPARICWEMHLPVSTKIPQQHSRDRWYQSHAPWDSVRLNKLHIVPCTSLNVTYNLHYKLDGSSLADWYFIRIPISCCKSSSYSYLCPHKTWQHRTLIDNRTTYIDFFKCTHSLYVLLSRSNRGEALCCEVLLYLFFDTMFAVYLGNTRWNRVPCNNGSI